MSNFQQMSKGLLDWHDKYNADVGGLFTEVGGIHSDLSGIQSEVSAVKSGGTVSAYAYAKNGNAHELTGEGAIMRFFPMESFADGDTITVNGEAMEPKTIDGQALSAGGFVAGTWTVAVKDGTTLQFLTQSYAGAFADIRRIRRKLTGLL